MKKAFRTNLGLSQWNKKRLEKINEIIEKYQKMGYRLTLRQLFYQLITQNIIPSKTQEYAKLSNILTKGRMAGIVDWDAIEDRLRVPKLPYWVFDIPDAINDTIRHYRLNRQHGQRNYVEVWCEKDALSNVLYRITSKYHIRLMVNRGYSSTTAMHDAYKRFKNSNKENIYILYLGDHDPSGLDMIRDVKDRQEEFSQFPKIHHVAITMPQINKYAPPPNPAKITDPRAKWYIAEHGATSWEVDALPPDVLHEILEKQIQAIISMKQYEIMLARENKDKQKLRIIAEKMKKESEESEEE